MQVPSKLRYLPESPWQKLSRASLATADGGGIDVELTTMACLQRGQSLAMEVKSVLGCTGFKL